MVSNTATVSRVINDLGENAWVELPIDQLVPGDLVKLAAGDMIPADLRILQARDLFVAQASLTGESLPVEKVARTRDPQQMNPLSSVTPSALWALRWSAARRRQWSSLPAATPGLDSWPGA